LTTAIIVAAGAGKRFGNQVPKQFLPVGGKPMLYYSLRAFDRCSDVDGLVVVVPPGREEYVDKELVRRYNIASVRQIVAGGNERQDSVEAGLEVVPSHTTLIAIHDGARPLVTIGTIQAVLSAADKHGAAVPGVSPKDTTKRVLDGKVAETLDRSSLVCIQTPQAFHYDIIRRAYKKAYAEGFVATDDAALVERLGYTVHVVQGDPRNVKVTTADDLAFVELLLAEGDVNCE
jgi:2-C-methyl-D-erythritol 4-phosphate cytidylyltransferase